jgi:two-component sensor histidine kinase
MRWNSRAVALGPILSSVPDYVFEPDRLAALEEFSILDTAPEPGFDDIVHLAMHICEAPVALVSLVTRDRQWFKARAGFEPCETDLDSSVCAHALVEPDLLVIPDLTADPRASANPLVTDEPYIRFYAGAPLRTAEGHVLGSLCVIDGKPRPGGLTPGQTECLRNLARQVISQLELRKALARQQTFLIAQAKADARRAGLLTLGDKLRDVSTVDEITRAAAETVARTLGAIRAGFGVLSEDGEFVEVSSDWTAPGIPSVAGRHRFADYGGLADDLRAGRPLVIEDVTTDPRTSRDPRALLRLNARSLVNVVVLEHGRPVAIFFAHFDHPTAWPPETMAFLRNVADRVESGVARLNAENQQRVLNHELSHRMKNTLSMVQAIAGQTLRGVTERDAVQAFVGRLHALSGANDVLLKRSWLGGDVGDVIRNVTGILQSPERFEISGPPLVIGPRATLSLSLLLHELTTNALKYGALSVPDGTVGIGWTIDRPAEEMVLSWRERGGPRVRTPNSRSFGSRLIGMGLVGTGDAEVRYEATGLEADFRASLLEVSRS